MVAFASPRRIVASTAAVTPIFAGRISSTAATATFTHATTAHSPTRQLSIDIAVHQGVRGGYRAEGNYKVWVVVSCRWYGVGGNVI